MPSLGKALVASATNCAVCIGTLPVPSLLLAGFLGQLVELGLAVRS